MWAFRDKLDSDWGTDPACTWKFKNQEKKSSFSLSTIQKINEFVRQLECDVGKQLRIPKYWTKLSQYGYCCSQPCIVLRTFDGYEIVFVIAQGMIKVSGVAHRFKNHQRSRQTRQCWECLYKISKLFRNIIIPELGLPSSTLSEDEQLKDCYLVFAR